MSEAQVRKKAVKMTTEEVIGKLFPKRAVQTARRFAAEANGRTKRTPRRLPVSTSSSSSAPRA